MSSGLYDLPGASATATAAAWAKRFDGPMTNVSSVYFGLSRAWSCLAFGDGLGSASSKSSGESYPSVRTSPTWRVWSIVTPMWAGSPSASLNAASIRGRRRFSRRSRVNSLGAAIINVDSCMVSGTQLDMMARLGTSSSATTCVHNRETSLLRPMEGPSVMSLLARARLSASSHQLRGLSGPGCPHDTTVPVDSHSRVWGPSGDGNVEKPNGPIARRATSCSMILCVVGVSPEVHPVLVLVAARNGSS